MGVYLCLGQHFWELDIKDALPLSYFTNFENIHEKYQESGEKICVFLGKGTHKIKKKAEQLACEKALMQILNFN